MESRNESINCLSSLGSNRTSFLDRQNLNDLVVPQAQPLAPSLFTQPSCVASSGASLSHEPTHFLGHYSSSDNNRDPAPSFHCRENLNFNRHNESLEDTIQIEPQLNEALIGDERWAGIRTRNRSGYPYLGNLLPGTALQRLNTSEVIIENESQSPRVTWMRPHNGAPHPQLTRSSIDVSRCGAARVNPVAFPSTHLCSHISDHIQTRQEINQHADWQHLWSAVRNTSVQRCCRGQQPIASFGSPHAQNTRRQNSDLARARRLSPARYDEAPMVPIALSSYSSFNEYRPPLSVVHPFRRESADSNFPPVSAVNECPIPRARTVVLPRSSSPRHGVLVFPFPTGSRLIAPSTRRCCRPPLCRTLLSRCRDPTRLTPSMSEFPIRVSSLAQFRLLRFPESLQNSGLTLQDLRATTTVNSFQGLSPDDCFTQLCVARNKMLLVFCTADCSSTLAATVCFNQKTAWEKDHEMCQVTYTTPKSFPSTEPAYLDVDKNATQLPRVCAKKSDDCIEEKVSRKCDPAGPHRCHNRATESNRTCAICCGEFYPGDPVRCIMVCYHRYHVPCIDRWFENNSTCPVCRRNLRNLNSDTTKPHNPAHEAIDRCMDSPMRDRHDSQENVSEFCGERTSSNNEAILRDCGVSLSVGAGSIHTERVGVELTSTLAPPFGHSTVMPLSDLTNQTLDVIRETPQTTSRSFSGSPERRWCTMSRGRAQSGVAQENAEDLERCQHRLSENTAGSVSGRFSPKLLVFKNGSRNNGDTNHGISAEPSLGLELEPQNGLLVPRCNSEKRDASDSPSATSRLTSQQLSRPDRKSFSDERSSMPLDKTSNKSSKSGTWMPWTQQKIQSSKEYHPTDPSSTDLGTSSASLHSNKLPSQDLPGRKRFFGRSLTNSTNGGWLRSSGRLSSISQIGSSEFFKTCSGKNNVTPTAEKEENFQKRKRPKMHQILKLKFW